MVVLVVLGVIVATNATPLIALYMAALALGALESAFAAVSISLVPGLVARPQLMRANGYLTSTQTAGEQFVGPALGGLLFAAGAALPFILDGASFGLSALLLALAISARASRAQTAARPSSIHADISEGMRWLLSHPLLRLLAAVIATLAFCQAMILAVLVIFGLGVLHLTTAGYGVFYGVTAIGNVVGALLAGRAYRRFGIRRVLYGAAVLSGASYLVLGATSLVVVAAAAMVVETVCVSLGNVASLSLRQQLIPSELLGRVGNNFRSVVFGAITFGAVVGGALTAAFGTRATFIIAGVAQIGLFLLMVPALSRRFREHEAAEQVTVDLRGAPVGATAAAVAG
jgi:MFS family permease